MASTLRHQRWRGHIGDTAATPAIPAREKSLHSFATSNGHMHKLIPLLALTFVIGSTSGIVAQGRQGSRATTATLSLNGKAIEIRYAAPSVRGRQIFGDGGLLSKDPTYPVWRAG